MKYACGMSYETCIYVDFDGTIAETSFPHIHGLKHGARETLRSLRSAGFRVMIFSCRVNMDRASAFYDPTGEKRSAMERFLAEHAIEHDGIWNGTGKPFGWIIDDKAVQFRDNWHEIGAFFAELRRQWESAQG